MSNFIYFYDQVTYVLGVCMCLVYVAGHIFEDKFVECTVDGNSIQFHDLRFLSYQPLL